MRQLNILRNSILLLVVCGWVSLFAAEVIEYEQPVIVDTCGEGMLLDMSGQRVLILSGNHYQMGYQQGRLLKKEVRELTEAILDIIQVAQTSGIKGYTHGTIEQAYQRTKGFIDSRFHEEMQGLADGAGIALADVQLANTFPELFHCSGFALFGSATKNGSLLHGRILDYMTEVGLQDYAVVTLAMPEGYNSFVNVGYTGFIGSVTGMNDQQIAIGEMGGAGEGDWDGMPMVFLLRKALEEASTLDQAVAIFRDTPRTCEYYYVISDAKIPDAVGLACTPDKFEVVKSGQFHELLPNPVYNTVLMSSGDRYKNLARLVKERQGEIDVDYALKLMDKPVAMDSCLHQVLFAPESGSLWVSNAVNPSETTDYAAFHQPFYRYNITELAFFAQRQGLSNKDLPKKSESELEKSPKLTRQPQKEIIKGIVSEDIQRPPLVSSNAVQQRYLRRFEAPQKEFEYKMKPVASTGRYNIYEVSFPTAYKSGVEENNTIYGEYYEVISDQPVPSVIILDIMDGSMVVSRVIANALANNGVNSCIMTMPHYGKRRNQELSRYEAFKSGDVDLLIKAVGQAVIDVRTTARWLSSLENVDCSRIGIAGTSLGGFIAALSAGIDGGFYNAAFISAGGDLATVLTTDSREVRMIKEKIEEHGVSRNMLEQVLRPIEPLTYANRLKNTNILMINGELDEVVPPECAKKLADTSGAKVIWHPADHYSLAKYLLVIISDFNKHFAP